jgi:hypothetical protein
MKGWALLIAVTFLFATTPAAAQSYEFSVEHEHTLRSCRGTLVITSVKIEYKSADRLEHSRFWRYTDIQNYSQSERFRFEIATYETGFGGSKTYNFQLKRELPQQAYDYMWARVYPSKLLRGESSIG